MASTLILLLPRRVALVPFVFTASLLAPREGLSLGPLTLYMMRLLLISVWIRILIRSERRVFKWNVIDKLLVLQICCGALAYVLLRLTSASLVNRLGWVFDTLGVYFSMRWLIRDRKEWEYLLVASAAVCVIIALFMFAEHRNGINLFAQLGSVPEMSEVRDGKVRSQGPFMHSILAGTYGANMAVMFVALLWLRKRSIVPALGISSALVIVGTSSSSTPFMACAAGLIAIAAWRIRTHMRPLRWCIIGTLLVLQLAMNNPIWAIIAKGKVFGGSTGWYRYYLIDNYIRHLPDWFLFGIISTEKWGRGLWDVTVTYVRVGVDGGLLGFILFLAVIVYCYKKVGRVTRIAPRVADKKCVWILGSCLTAHLFAFFGVNYWDQNAISWYMLLAVIAGCGEIFNSPMPIAAPESTHVQSAFLQTQALVRDVAGTL
jgi:hypothetical protein